MKVLYKQKESREVKHSQVSLFPNKLLSGTPKIAFWSFLVGVSLLASGCMHTKFTYKDTFSPSPKGQITQEIKEEQIVITKNFLTSELMKPARLIEEMETYGLEPKINRTTKRVSREKMNEILDEVCREMNKMGRGGGFEGRYEVNPDAVREQIFEKVMIFADNHSVVYGYTEYIDPEDESVHLQLPKKIWLITCEIPNVDLSKPLKFYNSHYWGLNDATLIFKNGKEPGLAMIVDNTCKRIELLPEIQPILEEVGGIENLRVYWEKGINYIFGETREGKLCGNGLVAYYHKGKWKKELIKFK